MGQVEDFRRATGRDSYGHYAIQLGLEEMEGYLLQTLYYAR